MKFLQLALLTALAGNIRASHVPSLEFKIDEHFDYSVNITIGSPGRPLTVHLRASTSDLVVYPSDDEYCAKTEEEKRLANENQRYNICDVPRAFDYNSSSSFSWNDTEFSQPYYGWKGKMATEKVSLDGMTIENTDIAVPLEHVIVVNLDSKLGLGPVDREATDEPYPNFLLRLYQEGLIPAHGFSWYTHPDGDAGTLLLGGIDHEKYTGDLQVMPFLPQNNESKGEAFSVNLNGIAISPANDGSDAEILLSSTINVAMDAGETVLPMDVVDAILHAIGYVYVNDAGFRAGVCGVVGSLVFSLNGMEIVVPLSDFMAPLPDDLFEKVERFRGKPMCELAIAGSTDGHYVLGGSVLRHLYVAYDLENKQVAMAHVNHDSKSSKVKAIDSDGISAHTLTPSEAAESITVRNLTATLSRTSFRMPNETTAAVTGAGTRASTASTTGADSTSTNSKSNGSSTVRSTVGLLLGLLCMLL